MDIKFLKKVEIDSIREPLLNDFNDLVKALNNRNMSSFPEAVIELEKKDIDDIITSLANNIAYLCCLSSEDLKNPNFGKIEGCEEKEVEFLDFDEDEMDAYYEAIEEEEEEEEEDEEHKDEEP